MKTGNKLAAVDRLVWQWNLSLWRGGRCRGIKKRLNVWGVRSNGAALRDDLDSCKQINFDDATVRFRFTVQNIFL